jgi:hypothetical protein
MDNDIDIDDDAGEFNDDADLERATLDSEGF